MKAIYALYPNAVTIREEEDGSVLCYDKDNNPITIDKSLVNAWVDPNAWIDKRKDAYPLNTDYLDGIVKGNKAQVDKYIADCLTVKAQYPKGNS
tara:strand:+ start:616 stop:897 length:282 start_codon:yes stop_codon:yes gene_type:complete